MSDTHRIKYFLYARKSSESEDRQIQSIDDQIDRLTQLAKSEGLEVVEEFKESKTAKKPNERRVFAEMLDRIKKGEAAGILCWQINRLSRNPVDSGTIQWMLQNGLIKSIQTIDKEYRPEDNVLLFSVESGMANQFIIDLRKNTLRGMESKLQKGEMPALARLGYKNDQINKTIVKDPERYDQVKQMWMLMLTGTYSVSQILKIVNEEWGFRTIQRKKRGGTPLSLSGLYSLFYSKFYAGIIEWGGHSYTGVHEPMITFEQYERVQELLGKKTGKPRPKHHEHPFSGIIRCGECGAFVTAETKHKRIKTTGELKRYDYYHCTGKKKYIDCSQKKVISELELSAQIEKEIANLTILPEFRDWAVEILNSWNDKEIEKRSEKHIAQTKTLLDAQAQLDSVTKMRYRDLITDDEYVSERNVLQSKITELKQQLRQTEDRAENWLELTERVFDFATHARAKFNTGSIQTKKEIFAALGTSFSLKDNVLKIEMNKYFEPVLMGYKKLEKEYLRSEPTKTPLNKERTEAIASVRSLWGE
jgi:site-specific DNA recombinase